MKRLSLSTAALSLALLTAPAIFGAALAPDPDAVAKAAALNRAAIVTVVENGLKSTNQEALELVRSHNLEDLAKVKLLVPRLAAKVEAKKLALADTVAVRSEVVIVENAFELADANKAKGLNPELALKVEDRAVVANVDLRDASKAKEATGLIDAVLKEQNPSWLSKSWSWSIDKVTTHWIISSAIGVTVLAAAVGAVYWKLSQKKTVKPKPTPKNRSVTPVA